MNLTRRLAWTALGSALLSAACLAGAYMLASAGDSGSSEIITREIPWDGNETLIADLPSVTRFVQAPGPGRIIARGPHRSVSTLTVTDGRIHDALLHTGAIIELVITAPNVTHFAVSGANRLVIEAYDQPKLTLIMQSSADIVATGHADNVEVTMQGAGVLNLANLASSSLRADIGGAGLVTAAPANTADLVVRNQASIVLLSSPQALTTKLEDDGRVIDAAPAP
jgi:hypothetical protein